MVGLPDPDGWIVGGLFSLSVHGQKEAFIAGDADRYHEVYLSPTERFPPRRVTDLGAQLDDSTLSSREVIR